MQLQNFDQIVGPDPAALLAAIVEGSQDAIIAHSPEGVVLSWNPGAERIYGYSAQEMVGRRLEVIIPAELREELAAILRRLSRGETVQSIETTRIAKDGRRLYVSLSVSAIRDADGGIVGYSSIARDITERRKKDEEDRRRQQLLTDFVENATEGLHWVGPDGKIIWANNAELESLGYTREEYIGHHISEFHADEDVICDILQRLTANEKLHSYEARMRAKDGSIRHVLINSNVYWAEGKFVHTRCFTRDITARKEAEGRLREIEERWRAIIHATPDCVKVTSCDGVVLQMNEAGCAMLDAADVSEIVGRNMLEFVAPEFRAAYQHMLDTVCGGKSAQLEFQVIGLKGNRRWMETRSVPLQDKTRGEIVQLSVTRDTSQRKESDAALREAQLSLSKYAEELERKVAERTAHLRQTVQSLEGMCYTMAHDLRSPLRSLQSFTQILVHDYGPKFDAEGRMYAERILAATARMDLLIRDLLEFARLSHLDLPNSTVDLNAEIEPVIRAVGDDLLRGGTIEVERPLPRVIGNPLLLNQVFNNLIGNALKFTPADRTPQVRITSAVEENEAIITVRDNGIGIPAEHRDRIFGLFQRLHTSSEYPGTGVGLAIVQKAIERMGGHIAVESVVNVGSTFAIRLPLAAPQ
jgi:PAS domain S-box-containing protein